MRKLISFMHISLDGFVAGPNREMNWIKVDEEIFTHVGKRISLGDTAMYGRVTFDMMESYWPGAGEKPGASAHDIAHSQWYSQVRKLVLSTTLKEAAHQNTVVINGQLADRIREIKQEPGEDILVFGSPTATHALIKEGLIDGYWLFVNPVILGEGIPLFTGGGKPVKLTLLSTHAFTNGVTELNYVVAENQ